MSELLYKFKELQEESYKMEKHKSRNQNYVQEGKATENTNL